jgi:AraC-like DNA-binding protein
VLEGTVSTHVARLARNTALDLGIRPSELAHLAGLDEATLAEDFLRVPTTSMVRMWQLMSHADPHAGLRLVDSAPRGTLHVWDYLFGSGATFSDGCREASRYLHTMTDPGDAMAVEENGNLLTVGFGIVVDEPSVVAAIDEAVLSLVLRRARETRGRELAPVRVAFAHPAPKDHRRLVEAFGTARIDFHAPANAITFIDEAPGSAPARPVDPELGRILRGYAEVMSSAARPTPTWHERFRACVAEALHQEKPSLEWVAARLAVSPRTLQRRLAEQGASWREEIESVRHEQAVNLLAETDLSVQSIAVRLGYADARALRRAFQRWTGQAPDAFRRNLFGHGGALALR